MSWTKSSRFIAGKKSQKNGRNFEDMIKEQCKFHNIKCIKHHVPTILSRGKLVYMAKGGPDFTLLFEGQAVFFDAKNFDSDRITHSQIHQHQLSELLDISHAGFTSGYLIWMREAGKVCWITASQLLAIEPGSSIKADEMFCVGQTVSHMLEPWIDFIKLFKGIK